MSAASPAGAFHRANALTYGSLLAGVMAIGASLAGRSGLAGALIALAVIADTFDGRFARMFVRSPSERDFGVQLDSLSDAIAFGIAPSVCLAALAPSWPRIGADRLVDSDLRVRGMRNHAAGVLQRHARIHARLHRPTGAGRSTGGLLGAPGSTGRRAGIAHPARGVGRDGDAAGGSPPDRLWASRLRAVAPHFGAFTSYVARST